MDWMTHEPFARRSRLFERLIKGFVVTVGVVLVLGVLAGRSALDLLGTRSVAQREAEDWIRHNKSSPTAAHYQKRGVERILLDALAN